MEEIKLRERGLSSVRSWPNYLPTFYQRSLTSFNTVVSLRNNYIQCPVPSKGRVLHKRQQLIGHNDTLPLSTYTHSVKIGFSQIITNTITQVWVKEFLQSTQESHYTQEFNCIHQAERERAREHGTWRWQLTLNKQPRREQVLCREWDGKHESAVLSTALVPTGLSQWQRLVPMTGSSRNVILHNKAPEHKQPLRVVPHQNGHLSSCRGTVGP